MSDVAIRSATIDDDLALAELDASAWPIELQVTPPRPATEPFFEGRREVSDVIVAETQTGVVGYAHVVRHRSIEANAHVLHLNSLAVASSARGLGPGDQQPSISTKHGFELEGRIREVKSQVVV